MSKQNDELEALRKVIADVEREINEGSGSGASTARTDDRGMDVDRFPTAPSPRRDRSFRATVLMDIDPPPPMERQSHSKRPRGAHPPELTSRILDTFADLMDARMESCQRMARILELREQAYF